MCAVKARQNLVGATSTDVFSEQIFRGPNVSKRLLLYDLLIIA